MSYFKDYVSIDENIEINGVAMPETSEPVTVKFNNISTGGRLADSIDYEGKLKGTKVNITLKYAILNKEHYNMLFNATQGAYLNKEGFFMTIKVPTFTPLGIQTFKGYFMSEHTPNCTYTTDSLGGDYKYGGSLYDELHENVEFSFVQK